MSFIEKIKSKEEWLKTTAENMSAFQSGAALAFTATFIPKMATDCFHDNDLLRRLTALECYLIFMLLAFGAILGTLLGAILLYSIGRLKSILLLAILPFLIIYSVLIFHREVLTLYLARTFFGVAIGATYLLLPIYNSETCTGYSAKEVYIIFFAYHAGGVCMSFYLVGYCRVRTFYIFSAVVSLISFLLSYFYLKESPYDLVKQGKFTDAERVLMKMQSRPRSEIDREMRAMEVLANQREATTYADLQKEKWDINALTISAILLALPHCSGVMGYITFAQLFYDELEINPFSHRTPTSSVCHSGLIHFAISLLVFRILTKKVRREVVRVSAILVTCALVLISFLYFDYQLELHIPMQAGWLPTFLFSWLMGSYSVGCSIFPWVIMMELFAPLLVHNALVVMCLYFWSLYFVVGTLIYILIERHFILGLLFVVFAVCCGFIAYFIHARLIETDGKSYADIKTMLNK